jgi:methyltransferase (TIGR00027 family)
VLEFKGQVLSARQARANCERLVVPCDLRGDLAPALEAAGLRAEEPTAWIAEGLIVYLTPEENESLLTRISELSPPGSRLGLTGGKIGTISARPLILDLDNPLRDQSSVITMWRSEAPDDPAAWLEGHGWAAEVFDPDERAAAYGRPLSGTDDARANPSSWLVSATKL